MIWIIIIISGLITFGMRFVFLTSAMPKQLSKDAVTAMRLVPIAVLWTIVVAEITLVGGQITDPFSNTKLLAALGAAAIAWRTKSVILTIGCGMPFLWAANYFFG